MNKQAFIIGSPRSGTTILENILGCHPKIADWYEPYYIWERYLSADESDVLKIKTNRPKYAKSIQKEYRIFGQKSKREYVLDKLPTHVFNIQLIYQIFPDAKYIHIIRDGRDVTLSIRKEWQKREVIVANKEYFRLFYVAWKMLARQQFLSYRLKALIFELKSIASVNPKKYLNKSRWKGQIGWGPRFEGWQDFLKTHTTLEFNAMQWVKCVEAARTSWSILPVENRLEIRYEDLVTFPEKTVEKVFRLLNIEATNDFWSAIPEIKRGNFNKWKHEFNSREIDEIKPILNPLLIQLGYVKDEDW